MSFIYNHNNSHESQSVNHEGKKTDLTDLSPGLFSSQILRPTILGGFSNCITTSRLLTTASFIASISRCIHRLRIFGGILPLPSFSGESSLLFSDIVGSAPKIVPFLKLEVIALDVGRSRRRGYISGDFEAFGVPKGRK